MKCDKTVIHMVRIEKYINRKITALTKLSFGLYMILNCFIVKMKD